MSDIIGLAILGVLFVLMIRDFQRDAKPKSQDDKFLESVKIKPWKGDK